MSSQFIHRSSSISSKESMEEIIVKQYKDSFEKERMKKSQSVSTSKPSPYELSVAPEHASLFTKTSSKRPMSAKPAQRRRRSSTDAHGAHKDNTVMGDLEEEKSTSDSNNYSSSFSDCSSDDEPENVSSNTKTSSKKEKARPATVHEVHHKRVPVDTSADLSKPLFKRQSYTITCNAYKNGSLEGSYRIASPNIKQLLESATLKLGLNTAARRVFLADGTEAFRPQDIPKDADVFISKGEVFCDPYRALKRSRGLCASSEWSVNGITLPPRRKIKPPASKRLNQLVGKRTVKVLVFRNGECSESHEVVFSQPLQYEKKEQQEQSPYDVIKRKKSQETLEKKHAVSFTKFLDGCTQRLGLNVSAKELFDWKGVAITHISQVERIEPKISPQVLHGPVWVSKSEGFNPIGSQKYIEKIIQDIRAQLQGAQMCKQDFEYLEKRQFSKISNYQILDLNEHTIQATKEKVLKDIQEFRLLIKRYKEKLKVVEELVSQQSNEGSAYTVKKIKEIEADDRLVGEHGLRIKIFDNGSDLSTQEAFLNMRDIQRGAKDSALVRARFLEALTAWHKPTDPTGPARSSVIRKLFDKNGVEIIDVLSIKNNDEVWLSYGEDFKSLSTAVVTLNVDRVSAVTTEEGENEVHKVYREMLDLNDLPEGSARSSQWEVYDGFPQSYKCPALSSLSSAAKYEAEEAIKRRGCSSHDSYLQHKTKLSLILRPSVKIDQKTPKAEQWPKQAQGWLINQNGKIYSRAFPGLALSVDREKPITVHYNDGSVLDGFTVTLKKKNLSADQWSFTPEGNICSMSGATQQQILTFLDDQLVSKVEYKSEGDSNHFSVANISPASQFDIPSAPTLGVLSKFRTHNSKSPSQRWGIKQESVAHPCQWKHTQVSNPQWRKLAYSWPVLQDGNWNKKYKWPMEGCLIANVPSLTIPRKNSEESTLRLQVYKNGEKDKKRFVYIVAPHLTNMEKDSKHKKNEEDAKKIEALEMTLFLEKATSLLDLRFAARRLFDENGKEMHSLRSLKRHQSVFVSAGEAWIDPRVTKAEHQRRRLLGRLTHDVAMIKAFCDLRNPTDLVIEIEKGIRLGSKLVVKENKQEQDSKDKMIENREEDVASDGGSDATYPCTDDPRTAHEKSHHKNDKKFQSKKYPWQVHSSEDLEEDSKEEKFLKSPRRSAKEKKSKRDNPNQKFLFADGFISPLSDPNLVFGVTGLDLDNLAGNVEVELCRKSIDDPVQQWEMTDDGFIRLKCSNRLVLGVSMPAYKPGQDCGLKFENCFVTVQNIKLHAYGRANQKWLYDPVTNFIQPFQATINDKEVTAANQVSICTYAVVGSEAISQDGFVVDVPSDHPVLVCCACAKVIRGQHPLFKAPENQAFVCELGNTKKNGARQIGNFCCLNGKVDLSTYEAETTLHHWVSQLEKLRQETSLRQLNREIHSSAPVQACRVVAMRNGEGRLRPGELIVGTSISGILDQCTQRLSLGSAARRLYTSDGMHILHMEQLIEWAVQHFFETKKTEIHLSKEDKHDYSRGDPEAQLVVTPENPKQEEGSNSREDTPDHSVAEAGIKVTASDLARKLRPPSGKRRSSADKSMIAQQQHDKPQEIPLSLILREPVEVWVSCGENFISPAAAEKIYEANLKAQINRNASNLMLDTEKHTLRHMQGRRFKNMSPSSLKPTKSPENPILIEGGWLETTKDEAEKLEKLHKLEEHLAEGRPTQPPPRTKGINFNRELYRQANRKRVLVYVKGESPQTAVYVWGESIQEILVDATTRLGLHRRAKLLYDEDGSRISAFELIERDSLLCVTSGDSFKGRPKQSNIAMKANWARTRKQQGPAATEICIIKPSMKPDLTNVDPFGPAGLTPKHHGVKSSILDM